LSLLLVGASVANAQPLVTGDLVVYLSFDEVNEDGFWFDGSGNGLNGLTLYGQDGVENDANEDGLPDIRLDTNDKVRGAGSAWFDTNPDQKEDRIAFCDPSEFPEGCDVAIDKDLIPTDGFTVSAWLKVEDVGQDQAIWQHRADGGGFTHTQVQGNGNVRVALRGDANGDNIVAYNEPPGGDVVPFEEWFHWLFTYQKGEDAEVPGEWAFYYNGEEVAGGDANGNVAGDPDLEVIGNWGQGAMIGMVPDFARQLVGHIDEFYLFKRGITAEEAKMLYELQGGGITGDFDQSGALDLPDIDDLTAKSASGANPIGYDLNGDMAVNEADVTVWVKELFGTWIGDANLDKEFNTTDLVNVLATGTYEANVDAVWSSGDWNGSGRFDSADLVSALADGGYEAGVYVPPAAAAVVPEPSALVLLLVGFVALLARRTM
jgi:hypothetical protein